MKKYPPCPPLPNPLDRPFKYKPPVHAPDAKRVKGKALRYVDVPPVDYEDWGWYYLVGWLVEWPDQSTSIVMGYYSFPPERPRDAAWKNGQYEPEFAPELMKELCRKVIAEL